MSHHVLVVDNDAEIRTLVELALSDEGYSVTQAANGQQALALVDQDPPRLDFPAAPFSAALATSTSASNDASRISATPVASALPTSSPRTKRSTRTPRYCLRYPRTTGTAGISSEAPRFLPHAAAQLSKTPRLAEALSLFEAAHQMARRTGIRADQATALRGIGAVQDDLGIYPEARAAARQSLDLYVQLRDRLGESAARSLLGSIEHHEGHSAAAKPYFERALAICEQVLGPEHPTTRAVWANLGSLPQS